MQSHTEIIKRRYNRTSRFYDMMDRMIKESVRKKAIKMAKGKVLEVGVGTGKNLAYYPPDCQVIGIDFSPGMLSKAREKVKLLGLKNVDLIEMDAQNLAFSDDTFDTVVATCVFCSVPDPIKGLQEVKRVCKPDGQIIFYEHVRSNNPVLGFLMDLLNPVTVTMVGANINRRTVENIKEAGIAIKDIENVGGKILKLIIAQPCIDK